MSTTSTSSNTSACSSRSSSPVPAPSLSTRSQSVISFMQLDSPAATTSELGYFETARLCKTPVEQSFKPKLLQKVRNLLEAEKRPAESEMAAEREIIQTCTTPNKPFLQNNEPLISSPNHLKSPTRISIYNGSKLNPDSEPIRRSEEYVAMAAAAIAASNTPLLPTPLPPPPPPCSSPNSSTRSSPFLPPSSALPALNSPLIAQRLGRKRKLSEDLSMAWDNQLVKRRAAMAAAVAAAAAANSGSGSPNTAAGASVYWQTPTVTPLDNGSLLCSAFPFNTNSPHMRPIKATQQSSSLSSQSAPGTPSGILLGGGGGGGRSNSSNEKLPTSSSRLPLSAGIGLTSGFFSRLTLDESTLATVAKREEEEEEVIGDKSTL